MICDSLFRRGWLATLPAIMVFSFIVVNSGPGGGADARTPRKAKRTASRTISPEVPPDSSLSDGELLKRNMDRYFAFRKPVYGSFVAIRPDTGEVLAISQFRNGGKIRNPALTAGFPAASIFKVVSAAALLEAGVSPDEKVCYTGGLHGIDASHLKDRKREKSCRTFEAAFAHSTNAVFAKLADRHLTADAIMDMGSRFGFGRTLNLGDLSTVSRTQTPKGRVGRARMAAGFSGATLSAAHGAVIAAVIANGGKWPSEVTFSREKSPESVQVVSRDTAAAIGRMMVQAVASGTGTKYLASIRKLSGHYPAIKTGSLTSRDGSGIWNNWMIGYFPAHKPEIAFAVHIGNTWSGVKAGQAARFALKTWLELGRRSGQNH